MQKLLSLSLITLSFNAVASDLFLESIKTNLKPISYIELKEKVKDHAYEKGYLSLGESHLQKETANQVNFDLLKTYMDQSIKRKTVFCTETLSHFLEPYKEYIEDNSRKYKVFEKNSPYVTDFTQCKDRKKFENYVTYSGFFHQYPFARPFNYEFPKTPVVTQKGNNIKAQMKNLDGLFVTQMELEYMEYSATRGLLNMKLTSVDKFRAKVNKLTSVTDNLVNRMQEIIKTDDPYTSKKAVVISADDFDVDLNQNDKAYIVMTNLSYRNEDDSFKALKALNKLSDQKLKEFLVKFKSSKTRTVSVFLGPFAGGELGTVTYPGVTRTFKGQSIITHIRNEQEDYLMVMEPDAQDFVCVDYQDDQEIDCF